MTLFKQIFGHMKNYNLITKKLGINESILDFNSKDKKLLEIIENKYHKWFLGVQFHPELKSKPFKPHPIFFSFIKNSLMNKNA